MTRFMRDRQYQVLHQKRLLMGKNESLVAQGAISNEGNDGDKAASYASSSSSTTTTRQEVTATISPTIVADTTSSSASAVTTNSSASSTISATMTTSPTMTTVGEIAPSFIELSSNLTTKIASIPTAGASTIPEAIPSPDVTIITDKITPGKALIAEEDASTEAKDTTGAAPTAEVNAKMEVKTTPKAASAIKGAFDIKDTPTRHEKITTLPSTFSTAEPPPSTTPATSLLSTNLLPTASSSKSSKEVSSSLTSNIETPTLILTEQGPLITPHASSNPSSFNPTPASVIESHSSAPYDSSFPVPSSTYMHTLFNSTANSTFGSVFTPTLSNPTHAPNPAAAPPNSLFTSPSTPTDSNLHPGDPSVPYGRGPLSSAQVVGIAAGTVCSVAMLIAFAFLVRLYLARRSAKEVANSKSPPMLNKPFMAQMIPAPHTPGQQQQQRPTTRFTTTSSFYSSDVRDMNNSAAVLTPPLPARSRTRRSDLWIWPAPPGYNGSLSSLVPPDSASSAEDAFPHRNNVGYYADIASPVSSTWELEHHLHSTRQLARNSRWRIRGSENPLHDIDMWNWDSSSHMPHSPSHSP